MACLYSLPNELLAQIVALLDSDGDECKEAPSHKGLHFSPTPHLFRTDGSSPARQQPLKRLSLVSRHLRAVVLPVLFRHVVWAVDRAALPLARPEGDFAASVPLLAFLRGSDIARYVATFTLLVGDEGAAGGNAEPTSVGEARDSFGKEGSSGAGRKRSLSHGDVAFAAETPQKRRRTHRCLWPPKLLSDENTNWLWSLLFDVVDPLRFTVVAPPRALATLLMCYVEDKGPKPHEAPLQILSLSRPRKTPAAVRQQTAADTPNTVLGDERVQERNGNGASKATTEQQQREEGAPACAVGGDGAATKAHSPPPWFDQTREQCNLFTRRHWEGLLLNEGNWARRFVEGVPLDEFLKQRQQPTIIHSLLGRIFHAPTIEVRPLIPAGIRHMEYVAIYPDLYPMHTLGSRLPRLETLHCRTTPCLDDPSGQPKSLMKLMTRRINAARRRGLSLLMSHMAFQSTSVHWGSLPEFRFAVDDFKEWEYHMPRILDGGWNRLDEIRDCSGLSVRLTRGPARAEANVFRTLSPGSNSLS